MITNKIIFASKNNYLIKDALPLAHVNISLISLIHNIAIL